MKPGDQLVGRKTTYDILAFNEATQMLTLVQHGAKHGRRMRNGKIKGTFTTRYDSERLKQNGYTVAEAV